MGIPKVFISYSHDSQEHKTWVLALATKLRNNGIDASLDQWDLGAGDDLPSFMERNVKDSDYVIIICTDEYVRKANSGTGGTGYEKMIISSDLIKKTDSKKFIPIIKQSGTINVPAFLGTKLFIDFSNSKNFEFNYDELVRTIHKSPLYEKPKIGNNPFKLSGVIPQRSNNALIELMNLVVKNYEKGLSSSLSDMRSSLKISRILFELLVKEAKDKNLIYEVSPYHPDSVNLTDKGKLYAVENNLIES